MRNVYVVSCWRRELFLLYEYGRVWYHTIPTLHVICREILWYVLSAFYGVCMYGMVPTCSKNAYLKCL
jgi:type IV secretory pathway VirB6-like protein